MCGIAGFIKFVPDEQDCRSQMWEMISSISHRGPDNQSISNPGPLVHLGHSRLSIIDLDEAANQPFSDEHGRFHIVFNGEIYNFKILRSKLESRGHRFKTKSDTEVLLNAYIEWGIECIHYLEGMFAFAIYDSIDCKMHLVRDRLGKKPLFYLFDNQRLIFGSEIKSILAFGGLSRRVDSGALNTYLSLGYCASPRTLFQNVKQLQPGHRIEVDSKHQLRSYGYWSLDIKKCVDQGKDRYIEDFFSIFDASVKKRLVGDVPIGSFLSGGIDSSAITVSTARAINSGLKTFSIGFNSSTYNELPFAEKVSLQEQTEHYNLMINDIDHDLVEKIVWHAEEPTADSSMVPTYKLCELAKQHVTVALSGDGADEIFAGYETYTAFYLAQIFKMIPKIFRDAATKALLSNIKESDVKYSLKQKVSRFTRASEFRNHKMHLYWRSILDDENRQRLLHGSNYEFSEDLEIFEASKGIFETKKSTNLNKLLAIDTSLYLPNDMLVKVDRMSMAHSLEVRSPFLDHKLVEFAFQLPDKYKLNGYTNKKYLLKEMLRKSLPKEILTRKKAGFNSPINSWIKGCLKEPIHDMLLSASFSSKTGFSKIVIDEFLKNNDSGKADHSYEIWNLYVLAIWFSLFQ